MPQSRLRIDNDLFVERVYQGTTQQEYSLSSKLRELKKDYTEFESEMGELAAMRKTPKRSLSRKGKEPLQKTMAVVQKNNENEDRMRLDVQEEKQRLARDVLRR